jgi:tetratricopeptide (TPR) repeat protein/peroxiredoxin
MRHARPAMFAVMLAAACFWPSTTLTASESNGTPAAKALYAQGDAAAKAGKLAEAAAAFRKAIGADPDFVDAHQRFIEVTQRQEAPGSRTPSVARLQQLYERWALRYPKRAVYQWALGFMSPEADKADVFFKKALAIDPAFARAYFLLAKNADQRGDWAAQRQYLKSAMESNPDEPRYLLQYGNAQKKSDPSRFREIALQVADKFPTSQSAAQALFYLAGDAPDPERRAIYERLRANYPVDKFGYSMSAMYAFYAELTKPSEALPLAQEMAKALPTSKTWQTRVTVQEAMMRAESLVADARFADALDLLEKTQRPSAGHGTTWTLLKSEAAAGSGHVDQAYAVLLDSAAAQPDPRIDAALLKQGTTLGKTQRDIDADIWGLRDANAKVAPTFELPSAHDGSVVKLADYRGRVALLAFWFPGCQGCREEFPYLQQVLEKFETRGLAVLAINLEPTQRKSVLPLLTAMGIEFVPVESDWAWAEEQYGVTGTPEALLLDQQGRIMFKPVVHDAETRVGLERQVEALLDRPRQ